MNPTITKHTDHFATSPQIQATDLPQIAALGFKTIICNRPDGEGGEAQPSAVEIQAEAEKIGLRFHYIPFTSGQLGPHTVQAFADALHSSEAPVLAYCRSGARSTHIWGLCQ